MNNVNYCPNGSTDKNGAVNCGNSINTMSCWIIVFNRVP